MRVTQNAATRNYLSNLQNNYGRLVKLSEQVYTQQKFSKMSENSSAAMRAMQVRRKLQQMDSHKDNVNSASAKFEMGENMLTQMDDICKEIRTLWIQGTNDDKGPEDRAAIATQIEKLQEEFLSLANGQYADKYLFGGTNTLTQPFTVVLGELHYNGVPMSQITTDHELFDDAAYVDIGIGIESDADGSVKSNSVFKNTMVGLEFMGTGNGNIWQQMSDMVTMLNSGEMDHDLDGGMLDTFEASINHLRAYVTQLGTDSNYLDFSIDRLEQEGILLTKRQQDLEIISSDEAIVYAKMQEYVYNAALQMGQRVLQPTLFDFMK